MAAQQLALPPLNWSNPMEAFGVLHGAVAAYAAAKHPGLEVALATMTGGFQGAAMGGIMGFAASLNPETNAPNAPKNPLGGGSPLVQARNFAVMTGVNSGLSCAIKKWRGKDDTQTAMLAALGSGAAFSLVSGINGPGTNPLVAALATGMSFAVLQGAFFKVGEMMSGGSKEDKAKEEQKYLRTRHLLTTLGLQQYEKNLRKGLLEDSTIMLWNDSALKEVKIPAGPRLRILHHLDQYRASVLKPALPAPGGGGRLQ